MERPYYAYPVCRWDTEAVRELRGTVYRGDGSVVEIVRGRLTDDVLQWRATAFWTPSLRA